MSGPATGREKSSFVAGSQLTWIVPVSTLPTRTALAICREGVTQ
jgi:hypothetical protein